MLKANYHTHTILCDGSDSPEAVARYAFESGMTHLGFSGHMDADIHMDWPAYVEEIRRLQQRYDGRMDILLGVELDTLYDPQSICGRDGRTQAEYIIGSTHFLDVPSPVPMSVDSTPEQLTQLCREYFEGDFYSLSAAYYALESQVYAKTGCTLIGHFDLITRFNDQMHFLDEEDPRYLRPALEAMEYLVSLGIPFEINCGAVNRGRKKELYPRTSLLAALHSFGGQILISSDAHQKELLRGAFDQAAACAMTCGFTHVNLLEHDPHRRVVLRQIALDTL